MLLSYIVLAINIASPHMPMNAAKWYGSVIQERERNIHIDPLIEISIATHESRWNSQLVSSDGEDYGLMQVRAKYCSFPSERLLNGGINLYIGANLMRSNYNYCQKKLGRPPETQEWLSCFQGSCRTPATTCKPTRLTNTIEKYAQCLEQSLIEGKSLDCRRYYNYDIN